MEDPAYLAEDVKVLLLFCSWIRGLRFGEMPEFRLCYCPDGCRAGAGMKLPMGMCDEFVVVEAFGRLSHV